ncbi:MAG: enoyl-CoA hydratase [Gammaproteobacteria bacterium]|nr:enoyl-CoA hydratase [Gammaproteobacteria bacterium]
MSTTASKAASPEPVLLREDRGNIRLLTLNRPAQYNALSEGMLTALQQELDCLAEDESQQVVILAANGKAFCAGHDLKEMRAHPDQEYYQTLFEQCSRVMLSMTRISQPVIACVQGMATAAGCQLVANADLAVASTDARFAVSGINLGLFCSTPGVALSRNIPRKRAFEMLITGKFIDAQTAAEWGLINAAVGPDQLMNTVMDLANNIAQKSPVAVRTGKQMFYRQLEDGLADAYAYAGDVMSCNMMAEDTAEGIDAFIEKRTPIWRGR